MTLAHGPIHARPTRTFLGSIGAPLSLLAAIALIVSAMLLPVVQSSDATSTGYSIRKHEQELADLDARVYNTQAEVAQLGSIARIHDEAIRIGMVSPTGTAPVITVSAPSPNELLLPRRYVPRPVPEAAGAVRHGMLWKVMHVLPLP